MWKASIGRETVRLAKPCANRQNARTHADTNPWERFFPPLDRQPEGVIECELRKSVRKVDFQLQQLI